MCRKISSLLIGLFCLGIVFENNAKAQGSSVTDDVVIEKPEDRNLPYRERRSTWGFIFAVNQEKFFPANFFSTVQNEYYDVF